ncbi:glycosyltransferase family 4 protein [Moorella sp. E306M]|uniref:glycosyltransferase family 4 protein n=1 Tax=Moorella sp. E306M TaxID=2572683 RepID=UPI0010FFAF99|nr:glycosyltransferase family 4 protein [Moorella sp. E306M]GEA17236.1 glycosyl transferase family 1 [Moorella sp. E306M]
MKKGFENMKICLIHTMYYPYYGGGAELTVQQIAEGLAARGHEVVVVSVGKHKETRFHNKVKIYEIELANLYWPFDHFRGKTLLKPFWHLTDAYNPVMARRVGEILDTERPDVVQAHNLAGFSAAVWVTVKRRGLPLRQVLHDYYHLCVRSTMFARGRNCERQCTVCRAYRTPSRRLSGLVDVVVGVSRYVLEAHVSRGLFPNAKQKIIHNGYTMHRAVAPGRLSEKVRFGYIGRLHPTKGLDLLIDAFLALKSPDTELLIAGEGAPEYVAALKQRTQGKAVQFLGHTSRDAFYPAIDVLIVPSIWHEPFGKIVIEGMAWGKPLIASCRGGIPEMVVDQENGFLFEPDDPGALLTAMGAMLAQRDAYPLLSAACIERAKEFSEEKMVEAYEASIWESLAGRIAL